MARGRQRRSFVKDVSVEEADVQFYVSNVRHAASTATSDPKRDSESSERGGVETIGVLKCAQQEFGAVINGIADALGGDDSPSVPLVVQRSADPYDDYTFAAKAIYGVWWSLFPLRRGLQDG